MRISDWWRWSGSEVVWSWRELADVLHALCGARTSRIWRQRGEWVCTKPIPPRKPPARLHLGLRGPWLHSVLSPFPAAVPTPSIETSNRLYRTQKFSDTNIFFAPNSLFFLNEVNCNDGHQMQMHTASQLCTFNFQCTISWIIVSFIPIIKTSRASVATIINFSLK